MHQQHTATQQHEEYMIQKLQQMEKHIYQLESQLGVANQEISNLKQQKTQLQHQLNDIQINSVGQEFAEAISKSSVERVLQRKEKGVNKVKKQPGTLKLDLLNQIFTEYPNLVRPIIHIKLTDEDFN
ncbi:unnamed protein product (macronuclear) [Paramecium tetraurelia]|uniref:Uncharacterized protein n=1 Tax=Paramecium tetraurelia TaxID=5888 RepID=A0BC14_PARTE|nr:uncharacterized protein GSPATT00000517001 [Paramecium tetraurelia]CAK56081.1 unnamed protein product [Paramecium tetraurelia]|eukprot:XP_001423479.1 hypothetical protein (macronuclear) [Paramecium tetraurelia strain d4-2]